MDGRLAGVRTISDPKKQGFLTCAGAGLQRGNEVGKHL